MRTFLAVEIPALVRRKIETLINDLQQDVLPIKWVRFSNLHITLKFLGEIDSVKEKEITEILGNISKYPLFSVRLSKVGCFPNKKNPRVLWVGIEQGSEQLGQIANELDQLLMDAGFETEKRFHGHVTIGRTKKPCKVDQILRREFESERFSVDSIVLFKSELTQQGPIYKELKRFCFT